jgi:tetratricopeptide (TPR) repeat protein
MKHKIAVIFLIIGVGIASIYGANFETANKLYEQGFFKQAETETITLLEGSPQNIEYRKLLAKIYISQGRFEEARDSSIAVLFQAPDDIEFNLILARIYSWTMEYDKSVKHYDKCLQIVGADDLVCSIEKARMLGWANRYKKALEQYEKTYERHNQDWILFEMLAKKALWKHRIGEAVENFEMSLQDNPDNEEALMYLAQMYSYSTMYSEANPLYESVKKVSPYNVAARESYEKNNIRKDAFHLRAGATYWKADSDDRQTTVSNLTPFISLSKYVVRNLMLTLTANRGFYYYSSSPDIKQTGLMLNADYQNGFYYGFGGQYQLLDFDKAATHHNYNVYGWYKLLDRFNLSGSYRQENVVSNFANIVSGLQRKYALARIEYDISRMFLIGADYMFGTYTDDNYFGIAGADLHITFFEPPTRLYTIFRVEDWDYRKTSVNYFSPGSYVEYSGLVGFKHNIAKYGLYYGAKEIYYDIQFRLGLNSNKEASYSPRFRFHIDFSPRVYIEGFASLYEAVFYSDYMYGAQIGFYL